LLRTPCRAHCLASSLASAQRGFTLVELLITISLLGIVLAVGIPSFQDLIRSNQASALGVEFSRDVSRARSEAISTNRCVKMCQSDAGSGTCATTGNDWQRGWVMFALPASCNTAANASAQGARLLGVRYGNAPGFTLAAAPAQATLVFDPRGVVLAGGNAHYVLTYVPEGAGGRYSRSICVSAMGRVNLQRSVLAC
jgi:type IV fimbrial biogenesis protein FimT